jgi:hypothetical protein
MAKIYDNSASIDIAYREILEELRALTLSGHRENAEPICSTLKRLSEDGLAIKAFALQCARNEIALTLTGSQSFALHANDAYMLRINNWYPKPKLGQTALQEHERYFSIGVCHNHNFDFFTTCILGPGYDSRYHRTDADIDDLHEGDTIEMAESWSLRLGTGDAMFVPRETHFHTQWYPSAFSATINLIPIGGQSESGRQYTLHDDCRTVKRVIVAQTAPTNTTR